MARAAVTRPECFVTALTGIRESLQVSLHVIPHMKHIPIANFPTISTGIDPILSSDDILADLLINLLDVGDGRIFGNYYWLREFSGFSDHIFFFKHLSLGEMFIVNDCLLQCQ